MSADGRVAAAFKALEKARREEQEASDAYAGDDLTEDWHRGALAVLLRAEDELKKAMEDTSEGGCMNIPKLTKNPDEDAHDPATRWLPAGPGWIERAGFKPMVRCNCNRLVGLGAHTIAKSGLVSASFLDLDLSGGGCGWHVWITLDGYNGPAFGPGEGR